MKMTMAAASILALLIWIPAAAAQGAQDQDQDQGIQGPVFLGVGVMPEYTGASSYMPMPTAEGQLNDGNYFVRFEGGALQFNVINDDNWHAGPLLGYRLGRGDVASHAVSRLPHIRYSIETGGFVEYEHRAADPRSGERLTLSIADGSVNTQSGWDGVLRGVIHRPLDFIDAGLIAAIEADATWGSRSYMQTYFGITPVGAALSGLPVFSAGSGFQSVGVGLSLDQFLSRHWSVGLRLHYAQLSDDAARSPVTSIAGSRDQAFAGVVIGYVL